MKTTPFKILVFLILLASPVIAQHAFQKIIEVGTSVEIGFDVMEDNANGYLVAGYNTASTNSWKSCLVKIDSLGNFIQKNDYGTSNDNGIHRFKKSSDGGYILAGYNIFSGTTYSALIIKLDSDFTTTWEKIIPITPIELDWNVPEPLFDVIESEDGNYIFAGVDFVSATETYGYVSKFNSSTGDTLWTKRFIKPGYTYSIRSIDQALPNGYILAGTANNKTSANNNALLIKIDENGIMKWEKLYGGTSNQIGNSVVTVKGGYAVGGKKLGNGWEVMILKTDTLGVQSWLKTYYDGNSDWDNVYDITTTSDWGYVITGYAGAGSFKKTYIVKADSAGTKKWSQTYTNNNQAIMYSVKQTSDAGFIFSGYTNNGSLWDFFVLKTDAAGANCDSFPVPTCISPDSVFTNENFTLSADIKGGNGTLFYNWKGQGGLNYTSASPQHKYTTTGNFNYTLEVTDQNGCKGICSASIRALLPSSVNISGTQSKEIKDIFIYQNSSDQKIEILVVDPTDIKIETIEIFTISGQRLYNNFSISQFNSKDRILANGMYIIKIKYRKDAEMRNYYQKIGILSN